VPAGRWYGGIDFGLRNPFAAVWGVLDRDDVLWLADEHYVRDKPLAYHVQHLPRGVTWYADPAGAREITELLCAGLTVRPGDNTRRPGIAAVWSRIENGTLKILEGKCAHLLAEAQLYRYETDSHSEEPVKDHDHAPDALRYLISKLDWKKLARMRQGEAIEPLPALPSGPAAAPPPAAKPRAWFRHDEEALWTRLV
jgi:hypothetical protein